ncbi:MAG TPA: 4-phosphopantetheinyl transferase [Myxococcales bacterium]|nr:4-phosphopantetheinyl transferase [Deltaproteobacteria bacterium]MBU54362.1 4-phosphopantetheinyl transferase [Deltaproteobacteria bacterium]HAA58637.1 4-phosphopantetheinyl transferase [Myxococcales bacterium]|tara:strand:- start:799 stop:1536 length:738 start_codon:yes stop_codon:yes gene_type:complete
MFDPTLYPTLQDAVHLYIIQPSQHTDPKEVQGYLSLLSEQERERHQRYKFDKHKHQFVLTRALIRRTLSSYMDLSPKDWRFDQNEYGRPEIAESLGLPPLRFNVSHTDGYIVCALTKELDIGVDVEGTLRVKEPMSIADRFFSPHEIQCLHDLPEEQRRHRFFQYWTLGEAYIKAKGMGLALPLAQFTFHLSTPPITISFGPEIDDNPSDWQFEQLAISDAHLLAIALKRGGRKNLPIIYHTTFP